ncbi:MAG: arsenate reductase ArsC [Candidatus Omnitrophica bacterium]|nr:arsenate reductase ArsC [Candidatus Omnitrophota bacterium]MBU1127601.1 arsenate reductase ArsC [Candidatus Omnitrophota bacterium]MBU1656828.1 arsenate reductase ArsC [Candidatus Omnitrophota bacterium]MBU1783888.1 arsenate reductase ArsC [Candidatus Omnitrophota bacterium]MBU1851310.1 arsenate reductase ArsC [Candidatus Omnitrophota bacterium]
MEKKKVLFLCTGNSCRSQMAEGFLKHMTPDEFEVSSAGTDPAQVNPASVRTMQEVGIDISGQKPESVNKYAGTKFDYVITVCGDAKETCPVFPGKYTRIHWDIEDPAKSSGTDGEALTFRVTREIIRDKIEKFSKNKEMQFPL